MLPVAKKLAVTVFAALIVTMQVEAVPLHAPPQPENELPEPGAAVNVTLVPLVKLALHVVPQLMPAGLLVTVPVPDLVTVTCCVLGTPNHW